LQTVRASGGSAEQYRLNHEGCPAGEDVRSRLYCKITEDRRLLLVHCFNCGKSGAVKYSAGIGKPSTGTWEDVTHTAQEAAFKAVSMNYEAMAPLNDKDEEQWPLQYFREGDGRFEFLEYFSEQFRQTEGTVILRRGEPPNVIGYDIRVLSPKGFKRVIHPEHIKESQILVYAIKQNKTAVVCEDPISAMKCAIAGYTGVALCGNNLGQTDAFKIGILYEKIVVWLDNDGAIVKANAEEATERLRLYNDAVRIERVSSDPKKYTLHGIRLLVEEKFT
jgi:hypothetical protein